MRFVTLTEAHRREFATFACASNFKCQLPVEREIQRKLAGRLRHTGTFECVGLRDGDDLVALAHFGPGEERGSWAIFIVAVRSGRQDEGLGRILLESLLAELQQRDGVTYAYWKVHEDNRYSHRLSRSVGADVDAGARLRKHVCYAVQLGPISSPHIESDEMGNA